MYLSAAGGLALVQFHYGIPGDAENKQSIGIPLEVELSLRILPVYRIGLVYAPVFTSETNTHRVLLVLHFGKVWN
jgi:hypothetical protein